MSHSVTLTWQPAVNEITEMQAYTIMRSIDGGEFAELEYCAVVRDMFGSIIGVQHCTTTVTPTDADKQFFREQPVNYVDVTVEVGHTYCYQIFATPLGNNISRAEGPPSPLSNTVCVEVSATATAVVLSGQVVDNDSVVLTWTASSIEGSTIQGYMVWRNQDGGTFSLLTTTGDVLTYTDTDVTVGPTYGYFVIAVPVVGNDSPESNTVFEALSVYYTSQIYPVQVLESVTIAGVPLDQPQFSDTESVQTQGDLISGVIASSLLQYTNGLPESIQVAGDLVSGVLALGLLQYTNGLPESIQTHGDVVSGTLTFGLVDYTNGLPESLKVGGNLISGTLT